MICDCCGQQVQEIPPRPIDLIDQLYLAFGPCCAGCDYWQHDSERTRPMGYCHKMKLGDVVGFDLEYPGSMTRSQIYAITDAKHVCPRFQDTFDWRSLGVDNPLWLKANG
jgi:hypothetical protein